MKYLLAGLLLLAAVPAAADGADAMRKAASDFYTAILPGSGIPDAAGRAKLRPMITPALDKLMSDAAAAETTFAATNKGAPPLVEGNIFASLFEGATSFAVGNCDTAAGRCAVDLTYDDRSGKPTRWTDTLYLLSTAAGWRVDDIGYGGSWAFANKGRLSDTLKQVLRNVSDKQ
jgi:hypothetical protein